MKGLTVPGLREAFYRGRPDIEASLGGLTENSPSQTCQPPVGKDTDTAEAAKRFQPPQIG